MDLWWTTFPNQPHISKIEQSYPNQTGLADNNKSDLQKESLESRGRGTTLHMYDYVTGYTSTQEEPTEGEVRQTWRVSGLELKEMMACDAGGVQYSLKGQRSSADK